MKLSTIKAMQELDSNLQFFLWPASHEMRIAEHGAINQLVLKLSLSADVLSPFLLKISIVHAFVLQFKKINGRKENGRVDFRLYEKAERSCS